METFGGVGDGDHTMSLSVWVSDELHDVTGMSDRNLAGETLYSWHFLSSITTGLTVIILSVY